MRTLLYLLLLMTTSFYLAACQKSGDNANSITVGTISGPETELMVTAKKVAEKNYNLKINIVEFSDYSLPNSALRDGSIDANIYQHKPYLDNENKVKGNQLVAIGKTFVYPMAIYSNKIKNIAAIQQNAIVAIPNDVSNEARALILLSKAKLITLKPGAQFRATLSDIASNPKNLQFKELDAAQLTRVLPDVTISVINTNYAILADLYPSKDAIFVEDSTSPYANLIVARTDNANNPKLQQLVKAYQSPEVLNKAKELFHGQAIAAW